MFEKPVPSPEPCSFEAWSRAFTFLLCFFTAMKAWSLILFHSPGFCPLFQRLYLWHLFQSPDFLPCFRALTFCPVSEPWSLIPLLEPFFCRPHLWPGLEKPGLKKKQPSGFFWVFWVFLGFFWVFCPEERVFRVFFSFTNTFGCIQTLNYNHSSLINLFLLIYVSALDWVSILFLSEIFLIECIPYYFL